MIYSMTAFARAQRQGGFGNLICEIRSINHRYLEISLHLPDILRVLEMPIREKIRHYLKRGKIEMVIRYLPSTNISNSFFSVNTLLAKELCRASEEIASLLKTAGTIPPTDILRFPGVLESKNADISMLESEVFAITETALKDLLAARAREGQELKQLFLQRIGLLQQQLSKVRERFPNVLVDQQQRLTKRFADAKLDLDPLRLEQEMVIFAQKIDVAEEIDRIETHLTELRRILEKGDAIGRRLDFLLQELNREANTLGSKSVDSLITHAAIEMKVLIEQVREQVQNVE